MSSTVSDDPARLRSAAIDPIAAAGSTAHTHRRISWAAIFGGVILAIAVQFALSLLGAAIGLGTVNLNAGTTPDTGSLGLGAGLWWLASSLAALAFGGYVAAWLAGVELQWDGLLHGLITWGIATLLTVYLLTSAVGGLIGGGASALGSIAAAAGSGIKGAAQPVADRMAPDTIGQQAQAFLRPANPDPATMSPQDAEKQVAANLLTVAKGGTDAPAARVRIIAIMAAQQRISTDQATAQFDDMQAKLAQARAQAVRTARDAADAAAAAAGRTAFAAFADLLLGAGAAALGGALAVGRRAAASRRPII